MAPTSLMLVTPVLVLQAAPPAPSTRAPSASPLATSAPPVPPSPPATRVLTLAQATEIALAIQPQLRQARAQTNAAMARADQALAPLLPQVTAVGSYQRSTANFTPRPGALPAGIATVTRPASFD